MTERACREAAEYLASPAWRSRFEGDVLERGAKLARRRALDRITVEWLEGDNLILSASVESDQRDKQAEGVGTFKCEVVAWPERGIWQLESSCDCAQQRECIHAAALLAALPTGAELEDLLADRSSSKSQIPHPKSQLPAGALPAATPDEELELLRTEPEFHLAITREALSSKESQRFLETLAGEAPQRWLIARPQVRYGPFKFELRQLTDDTTSRVHDEKTGQPLLVEHNRQAEDQALSALRRSGLLRLSTHPLWRRLHHGRPPEGDAWLPQPSPQDPVLAWAAFRRDEQSKLEAVGWHIDFPASAGSRLIPADPDEWEARLEAQGGGWFSLSVGFEVNGKIHNLLPLLAKMLAEGVLEETLDRPNSAPILIPLPEASADEVLEIPLGRLRRILRQLFAVLHPGSGGKQGEEEAPIHALDAAALAAESELDIEIPAELTQLQAKLEELRNSAQVSSFQTPLTAPVGLQATLREYQLEGFAWLQFLARFGLHGVLADDMGLGKTLQTLAHILAEKESDRCEDRPSLVVAPTSVIPNWIAEARRLAPTLRVLDATGPRRHTVLPHLHHADLVLTSYALLHRDLRRLAAPEFHLIALDEAQYIKNPAAQSTRAACQLKARHRLALSGTPIENHLGELWSVMRFLQPGFLGTESDFNSRFRTPIEKNGDEDRAALLRARVAPLILRRTKAQVATELPPKTELIHSIELSAAQKDLYEAIRAGMDKQVRQALAIRGDDGAQMLFLSALLKLRQVCCDPRLLTPPPGGLVPSAKLNFLLELLEQLLAEDSHILIFSQFTSMLELIGAELKKRQIAHLVLTGASKERGKLVERFQSGNYPVFLISLKAGGTGLNLTRADSVIHYDPWWNPAVEAQATDRAYRIGQTRPVFVHKLLCQDSVEERIHKLQREKAQLADTLLSETHRAAKLDTSMLETLLAPLEG